MKNHGIIFLVLMLILLMTGSAQAIILNFEDAIYYPDGLRDYGGLLWGNSTEDTFSYGGTTYTSIWGITGDAYHSPGTAAFNAWGGNNLWFSFSAPVHFVGAWFGQRGTPDVAATEVRLRDNLGHQTEWFSISTDMGFLQADFIGSETIWVERRGGVATYAAYRNYAMDDLEYNTSTVPVPASLLLLGSGLLGVAGLRRRFKR